jgi:hypothetical protein
MNLKNFSIADDFIALEQGESYFDLHNNFSFVALSFDVALRKLTFEWKRRDESWVSTKDPESLELQFNDVSLFKIKERDSDEAYTEDDCLSSMGFIHNELLNEVEGFSNLEPTDDANHLNIGFQSGFAVKVAAGSVSLNVLGNV